MATAMPSMFNGLLMAPQPTITPPISHSPSPPHVSTSSAHQPAALNFCTSAADTAARIGTPPQSDAAAAPSLVTASVLPEPSASPPPPSAHAAAAASHQMPSGNMSPSTFFDWFKAIGSHMGLANGADTYGQMLAAQLQRANAAAANAVAAAAEFNVGASGSRAVTPTDVQPPPIDTQSPPLSTVDAAAAASAVTMHFATPLSAAPSGAGGKMKRQRASRKNSSFSSNGSTPSPPPAPASLLLMPALPLDEISTEEEPRIEEPAFGPMDLSPPIAADKAPSTVAAAADTTAAQPEAPATTVTATAAAAVTTTTTTTDQLDTEQTPSPSSSTKSRNARTIRSVLDTILNINACNDEAADAAAAADGAVKAEPGTSDGASRDSAPSPSLASGAASDLLELRSTNDDSSQDSRSLPASRPASSAGDALQTHKENMECLLRYLVEGGNPNCTATDVIMAKRLLSNLKKPVNRMNRPATPPSSGSEESRRQRKRK